MRRSINQLRRVIAETLSTGATGLGTTRDLARRCGVSVPTVARALRALREAGVVAGGRGRTLQLVAEAARNFVPSTATWHRGSTGPAWQRACTRIEELMRSGAYRPPATFPSVKELTAVCGANYRTVKRALEDLCARSLLCREGVRYALPRAAHVRKGGEIVLIARGAEAGERSEPVILYERTQVMLSRLDEACQQAGVRLTTACMYYKGLDMLYSPALREVLRSANRARNVLGVVIWPVSLVKAAVVDLVESRLLPLGFPVAVFDDEDRMLPRSLSVQSGGALTFFSLVDQRAAGRAVGQYLAASGCRRVVYVANGTTDYWVLERLAGLREAMGAEQCPEAVTALHPAVADRAGFTEPQLHDGDEGSYSLQFLAHSRNNMAYRRALVSKLAPLVAQQMRDGGADAWVGANDVVALACMDLLVGHGVRVGTDTALIGFDNSAESVAYRLSSYGFNEPALVDAMLQHILDRRWTSRFRDAGPVVHVNGMLAERESSSANTRSALTEPRTPSATL